MRQLIFFIIVSLNCMVEAALPLDEALSKKSWSHFGPLSQHYVIGRREKPQKVYAILKTYVNNMEATVLDLGSGTGISTRQLYKNGFKNVIGVDRDALMLKEAKAANTASCCIKYIQADVSNELPFADEQFDVVTASSAFHWFANPSSIKEVARLLKPNGYYFVIGSKSRYKTTKSLDSIKTTIRRIIEESGVPPKPKKEFTPVANALENQGFKIIIETAVPYIYYYSKQEYLSRVQSQSYWNLVKESQKDLILRKIDHYLDTVMDEKGRIIQEGNISIVLAQKP